MNQPLFLHIVEKLEGLLGKLPVSIQKPILHELTPLKELFLQQRPARLVLVGASKLPLQELLPALLAFAPVEDQRNILMEVFRWQDLNVAGHGTVAVLDAREADDHALVNVRHELERQPADVFVFVDNGDNEQAPPRRDIENLAFFLKWNSPQMPSAKVVGISLYDPHRGSAREPAGLASKAGVSERRVKLQNALMAVPEVRDHLLQVLELRAVDGVDAEARVFMALLAQHLPNQARVEMIRISHDREAQTAVAQVLVKSTTAICTAIGAQPIPLADLPVLTTLQLVMVSGIMYLSGRERSLRASTEFIGALGANVGAGMVLREGTRALLKFFPGWGNIVCGMVAGAGTYAIGRAAIVYFVEGVSLRDARRTYLRSRKKSGRPGLPAAPKSIAGRRG